MYVYDLRKFAESLHNKVLQEFYHQLRRYDHDPPLHLDSSLQVYTLNYSLSGNWTEHKLRLGLELCPGSAPKPVRDDTDDTRLARLMIANTFPPSFIKLRHFNLILCKLQLEFPGDTH